MIRRSSNSNTRPCAVIVCTCFSRVSDRMRRCASPSAALLTTCVGPEDNGRRISWATPPPGTKSVLRPTAGSPRSWKPQPASNIVIPMKMGMQPARRSLHNDVHQLSGHHADLLRLLPVHELLHRLVGERETLDLVAARVGRHV